VIIDLPAARDGRFTAMAGQADGHEAHNIGAGIAVIHLRIGVLSRNIDLATLARVDMADALLHVSTRITVDMEGRRTLI